ncbi:MAG TPA: glutathione S-transferase N-terminal domain-containing protein, partial [Burkholderiaceae bacterium]|nr:glutathione S-transferase N-terminal domain-containing protein [Burkholderiaceae bacterium]
MKLYYSPGACSLSPHIVARAAGLPLSLVRVDTKARKTAAGDDYRAINGKAYVPMLELEDGTRLTEGPAIVQYLADRAPEKRLAPANGTMERYKLQEWLNFITSEIHKQFSPLFDAGMPD